MLCNEPVYLGLSNLGLSKKIMYETYYDVLQYCYAEHHLKLHLMDFDLFNYRYVPGTGSNFGDMKDAQKNFVFTFFVIQ